MPCLLFQAGHPEGHGIRPHSLKVTTISTLMTEVIKGQANLYQLAIQGNYRAVAAHGMDGVYSRNLAHREIFVSRLAHKAFRVNRCAESIADGTPEISEARQTDKKSPNADFICQKPVGWAPAILETGTSGCLKKDRKPLSESFGEVVLPNGQLESGPLAIQVTLSPHKKNIGEKEILLITCADIECLNYRFPKASLTGESPFYTFPS